MEERRTAWSSPCDRPWRAPPPTYGARVLPPWSLRPMAPEDAEWLVELKTAAMRRDLERLGIWDPARSRRRLLEELVAASTWVVTLAKERVGSIGLRPDRGQVWLQHFYVLPEHQGRGLGTAVLAALLERRDDHRPLRLLALHGSAALPLYARHGFTHERDHENGVDVVLVRPPG